MKEEILDIAKKLYHNHLTPEEATNLLLDLFGVNEQSEQFNCGKERVFGEDRCDNQCNDCLKEYGSN